MSIYTDEFLLEMREWFKANSNLLDDVERIEQLPWNAGKVGVQEAWNKGKKLSEEHKRQIAESVSRSTKGVKKSEEHKRKSGAASGAARKGKKLGPRGPYRKKTQENK